MKPLRILSSQELNGINAFLEELQNDAKYQARLAEIEAKKIEVNDLIEVWGKASDIDRIVSNALRDEEQAKKNLDSALAEQKRASEEAIEVVEKARRDAQRLENEANSRWNDREQALFDGEAELNRREKKHAKSIDDLVAREAQLAVDMERAVEIRTKYTEAVRALKDAITDVAKAL